MLFRARTAKICFSKRKHAFDDHSKFSQCYRDPYVREDHGIPNSLVGILRGGTDIASEESLYYDFVQGSLSDSGRLHLPVRILLSRSKNRSLDDKKSILCKITRSL